MPQNKPTQPVTCYVWWLIWGQIDLLFWLPAWDCKNREVAQTQLAICFQFGESQFLQAAHKFNKTKLEGYCESERGTHKFEERKLMNRLKSKNMCHFGKELIIYLKSTPLVGDRKCHSISEYCISYAGGQ